MYPIDTSDLTKGYYQYIWEDNAWMGIGTTRIDLTNYAALDGNNTYTGTNTFGSIVVTGNISDGTNTVSVAQIKSGLAEANPAIPSGTTPTALTGIKVGSNYYDIQSVKTQSTGGATSIQLKTWVGTQAQYDSITTKDANTQYIII